MLLLPLILLHYRIFSVILSSCNQHVCYIYSEYHRLPTFLHIGESEKYSPCLFVLAKKRSAVEMKNALCSILTFYPVQQLSTERLFFASFTVYETGPMRDLAHT